LENHLRYFDTHLHVPTPDIPGLDRLRKYLDTETGLTGGLLILNTPQEVEFINQHRHKLPSSLRLVPYFAPDVDLPEAAQLSGWYKIHPELHRIDAERIPSVVSQVGEALTRVKGLIVHCFPWGPNLRYCVSLPLVIALSQAFPNLPILATHGGGYESWALRAHTGSLPNVLYDFSVSLKYFRGTDLLAPFGVYARTRPQRLLFGSDWPWAEPGEQLDECVRLAQHAGVDRDDLMMLLLANAQKYWPETDALTCSA
jgi:predicted TIM-barrel fold metal-dependent hydrolase